MLTNKTKYFYTIEYRYYTFWQYSMYSEVGQVLLFDVFDILYKAYIVPTQWMW